MLFFAIAHIYGFRIDDFTEGDEPLLPAHRALFNAANVTDIIRDTREAINEHKILKSNNDENSKNQNKHSLNEMNQLNANIDIDNHNNQNQHSLGNNSHGTNENEHSLGSNHSHGSTGSGGHYGAFAPVNK